MIFTFYTSFGDLNILNFWAVSGYVYIVKYSNLKVYQDLFVNYH